MMMDAVTARPRSPRSPTGSGRSAIGLPDAGLVPCVDGAPRRYVNLDYAASTPVLAEVLAAVEAFLPWCSSVHRGSGFYSQVATAALEGAREAVAEFVGSREGDEVVFVRNTTEAINVLAAALPAGTRVLSSPIEHHANMLPWRRHEVDLLPFTDSPAELVAACDEMLDDARGRIELVAVTGASNVTGEVWPVAALAEVAHRHGAELLVDAAQLAPHRPIDMREAGIDYLALSGHKLYAPFGGGALVARPRRLRTAEPLLRGGGAIKFVTLSDVVWADLPDRFEAGSPNVPGAVALGAACDALLARGMEEVAAEERALTADMEAGLRPIPGLRRYRLWRDDACDRVGVLTFNLDGYRHSALAAILSAEYAIGVRSGCFCAHPLVTRLLGVADEEAAAIRAEAAAGSHRRMPGAVRASLGLGSRRGDVAALTEALVEIAACGPRWRYVYDDELDEHRPEPDPRSWPALPIRLSGGLEGPVPPDGRPARGQRPAALTA